MSRIHSANGLPGDRVADTLVRGVPEKEDEEEDDEENEEKQGEDDGEGESEEDEGEGIQNKYRPALWPSIPLTES
jgi:hypothetical protein